MDLRYIDPMKIKFVRKINNKGANNNVANKVLFANNTGNQIPTVETTSLVRQLMSIMSITQVLHLLVMVILLYSGGNNGDASIKIAKDSIAYCNSGLIDRNNQTVLLGCISLSRQQTNSR